VARLGDGLYGYMHHAGGRCVGRLAVTEQAVFAHRPYHGGLHVVGQIKNLEYLHQRAVVTQLRGRSNLIHRAVLLARQPYETPLLTGHGSHLLGLFAHKVKRHGYARKKNKITGRDNRKVAHIRWYRRLFRWIYYGLPHLQNAA